MSATDQDKGLPNPENAGPPELEVDPARVEAPSALLEGLLKSACELAPRLFEASTKLDDIYALPTDRPGVYSKAVDHEPAPLVVVSFRGRNGDKVALSMGDYNEGGNFYMIWGSNTSASFLIRETPLVLEIDARRNYSGGEIEADPNAPFVNVSSRVLESDLNRPDAISVREAGDLRTQLETLAISLDAQAASGKEELVWNDATETGFDQNEQ